MTGFDILPGNSQVKWCGSSMIVFDLEWNRGYDKLPLDEILQIGAVRTNALGGAVTDWFNVFIRPAVHRKFDYGAKALPELRQSIESRTSFPSALEAFRQWCAGETEFAAWGEGDLDVLKRNCQHWGVACPQMERIYNLQTAFSHAAGGEGRPVALWRAVDYCGIPDIFTYHDALSDALYAALLSGWIRPEELERTPPRQTGRRLHRLVRFPFPPQPKRRVGPFPCWEAALNARQTRRLVCPFCGEAGWVQQWYCTVRTQCLALFRCPEHGAFLCRLTLTRRTDGSWVGRLAVPAITEQLIQAFQAARKCTVHQCSKGPHRRRRGRRRPSRAAAACGISAQASSPPSLPRGRCASSQASTSL